MNKLVMIGTPTQTGDLWADYQNSLIHSMCRAAEKGWAIQTNNLSLCSLINYGRAIIAQDFMDSECDTLFFIDSDLAWDPEGFVSLLEAPMEFMGGAYPQKIDGPPEFHIALKEQVVPDGTGRKILLDTSGVGGGFVKITRSAMEKMHKAYPELKANWKDRDIYMLWDTLIVNGRPLGEDLSFCYRWTSIGGKIYVDPDIDFKHYGRRAWSGNFLKDKIMKGWELSKQDGKRKSKKQRHVGNGPEPKALDMG
jgi:hypothetical protein